MHICGPPRPLYQILVLCLKKGNISALWGQKGHFQISRNVQKKKKKRAQKRHHKDEQEYLYQLEVFSGLINYWNENANPIFVTP